MWRSKEILKDDHEHQLEADFSKRVVQGLDHDTASNLAHTEYKRRQHSEAAAFHFAHSKRASDNGRKELADKHWAMYKLHLGTMREPSKHTVPDHVKVRLEDVKLAHDPTHFNYHPADIWAGKK